LKLLRYASLERWCKFAAGQIEVLRRKRADDALDAVWNELGPLPLKPGGGTLIADGWGNPGYFLRLRLFIAAIGRSEPLELLGVLRRRSDKRYRRAMERIGFREFIYIEDDAEFPPSAFLAEADRLLSGAASHADLLTIRLPEDVPAYIWYDTVLSEMRHGRPELDHPVWRHALANMLSYIAIYRRELARRNVVHIAQSHAWKSEWGALLWLGLKRQIPCYCVTHFSEAIRIRRFRTLKDFELPVEHLPATFFDGASPAVRRALSGLGHGELIRRQSNQTSDVNIRFAYDLDKRITDRREARLMLGVEDDAPVGVIYGHSWFDFPHLYAMANFTDFVDWFEATVEAIRDIKSVRWFLKPHPMEVWYGGHRMSDMIGALPDHVRVLPHEIDTMTVMKAADTIVNVHGTSTLEAVTQGLPVICADRSYYSDWGFAHVAKSRADYAALLARVGTLQQPDQATRDRAAACLAGAYGEPHDFGALRLPCDSLGSALYPQVKDIVNNSQRALEAEIDRIAEFLAQTEVDSFETWSFVCAAERQALTKSVA
jgi:hypothetical protein